MSDLEFLFAVLVAFYLWECVCWVRRGGVAFTGYWGKYSTVAPLIGNLRGGFALAQPFPPLGQVAVATQLPVSLSADGVLAYVGSTVNPAGRPLQSGRFMRWGDVKSVEARGKSVRINGVLLTPAQSTTNARRLRDDLRAIVALPQERRPAAIAKLIRSTFNTSAIRRIQAQFEMHVKPLRWVANALLLFVFLFAPAVLWKLGLALAWIPLALFLITLLTATAFLFRRAHAALYPAAVDERFNQFLMILLYPPAAIRACDALSRPLFEFFHPLAVASVLCQEDGFRIFARQTLLDLRYPARPLATEGQPALTAVEEFSRATVLAGAESLIRRAGMDPEEITRAPEPMDAACRAYCPRCRAQFTTPDARCADCGGMPLMPFIR